MRPVLAVVPVVLVTCLLPSTSSAAALVKLACTSQGRPLPRNGRVPGPIDCLLSARQLKGVSGTVTATLQASWDGERGTLASSEQAVRGGQALFRFSLEPGTAFPACERFELAAVVEGPKGPLGRAKLAVTQECPKATLPAGPARMACSTTASDGTRLDYPGNGEHARGRLVRELNCAIVLDRAPDGGAEVLGRFRVGRRTRAASIFPKGEGVEAAATFFPDDDFPSCQAFTAEGELTVDGQVLFKSSLSIPQSCER